jgi:hypothetical protein
LPDAVTNSVGAGRRHLVSAAFTTATRARAICSEDSPKTSNVVPVRGGGATKSRATYAKECTAEVTGIIVEAARWAVHRLPERLS